MKSLSSSGIQQFLDEYPRMAIIPSFDSGIYLKGKLDFQAVANGYPEIQDHYDLQIFIPPKFPNALPGIRELGGRITPDSSDGHLLSNGDLCLGSPIRLRKMLHSSSNICDFMKKCLIPYLYAISIKARLGDKLIIGGLAHGKDGLIEDYSELLGIDRLQVIEALRLLALKKRIANKQLCPCGCGKRLGKCDFHYKLNEYRKFAAVSWFKMQFYIISANLKN